MSIVIKVEDLSKAYQLGQFNTGALSQDIERWWALVRGKEDPFLKVGETNDRSTKGSSNIVWSLRDINLEIEQGDAAGIVGKNGAGKSTLLKILSRVTSPTTGNIKIKGRVTSLLEVGTGFHPELTGRENIYLNGAILGMRKREIKLRFDEIVEFAGIERYIDTPVKRYSSGMYVRLAFAVAAHLESEILIVDEVLAVGDAEFQKKCLGKMGDISKGEGRTILFVSHNLSMVKGLCSKGFLLNNGEIKSHGSINDVLEGYTGNFGKLNKFKPYQIKELGITVSGITINEGVDRVVRSLETLEVKVTLDAKQDINKIGLQLMISHLDTSGYVFVTNTKTTNNLDYTVVKGKNVLTCLIDRLNLCAGKYWLGFAIDLPFVTFYSFEKEVLSFEVEEEVIKPRLIPNTSASGHVYLDHKWDISH